jgi:hypothetical protein
MTRFKRSTYPDADGCGAFAAIAVAVTIVPLMFVEVVQIVTTEGVVTDLDPFDSVVVETRGFDRVEVGCVVIVLVFPPEETTVTRD